MPDMSQASLPIIDDSGLAAWSCSPRSLRFFDQPLAYKMGPDKALSACNCCITAASSRVPAGDR